MPKLQKNKVAHERVASVCHEIARCIYEEKAKDNAFFKANADAGLFCRNVAPYCRPIARAILAHMLEDKNLDEKYKQEIMDSILLDKMIPEIANLH